VRTLGVALGAREGSAELALVGDPARDGGTGTSNAARAARGAGRVGRMSAPVHVLGLNAWHGDAAACLLRDGALVAAAEEERFRRVKHWAGFPVHAIRYCLRAAGIGPGEVAHVAVNGDPRAHVLRKAAYALRRRPELALLRDRIRSARERLGTGEALGEAFPGIRFAATVHRVEHHHAHLASCFLPSPFERAVAVSVDGFGDFASAAWGPGRDGAVEPDARVYFPHSLGIYYQALTQYLGFPHYGDEYKLMGLAARGAPTKLAALREVVRARYDGGGFELSLEFFRHHRERIDYEWDAGAPVVGRLWSDALADLLGPPRAPADPIERRHEDLAASVQARYEEVLFGLLRALHARYRLPSLALAGGCALNSVANGRIAAATPFERVWVQPAAGDAGGALGAALEVWRRLGGGREFRMTHAYWGPGHGAEAIEALLEEHAREVAGAGATVTRAASAPALVSRVADLLADGAVVGWFHGRMEWGPRALGNRSILCDPRRADAKALLNERIKRREPFRPFAPSVLREHVHEWFETDAVDRDLPFMTSVLPVRAERRASIPAVVHVDGTGRPQTVTREANPLYHDLIRAFAERTGVPMLLNTSFNENEPIVCAPGEALDCFLRTRMDALALGPCVLER